MKQRMEKLISTLREKARRTRVIRKTVGLGLAIVMLLGTPSWSGLIKSVFAHEDKAGAWRCIYVDTSLIGADSDVMESGIGAYVYNREGGSYSDAPIMMEKVEGKRNIYQLVLDDYYTYVEFTKGSDLDTGTKTEALAIDWSLGSPCYMFNSEALSDGGRFYGLYSIYFDLNGAPDASAFADNGVGIYAYNSDEDSYTAVPVAMKASGKGDGVYEYSFDKPYDCIAFMGGYGSWNYEVATTPVYMDWSYSAPCFFLEQVNGQESTGTWRNIRYTVYFDASDIKDDEAFIENGVWLYAFNDSDDKLSEEPVKMVASSVGSYIYEYTMERPYENLQFILGDSLDAEVSSEVLYNDWLTYAEPCYMMTLDRKEILKASPSPSMTPSASPSGSPSATPSVDPSASPSGSPSATPSTTPSASPSGSPSATPSMTPSASPSGSPSATPSIIPTPSATPSITPAATPTTEPAADPVATPTPTPAEIPTDPTESPAPEQKESPTPDGSSEGEENKGSDDTENKNPSDSGDEIEANPTVPEKEELNGEPAEQTSEEARVTSRTAFTAGDLTVTYGTYEMPWVGAPDEDGNEPANTIENEKNEDTGDVSTPEELPDADEATDSTTSTGTSEVVTPDGSDEKPAPAPATGGESGGEQKPSDALEMISPSASATPIDTEENPVETEDEEKPTVEATISVVSVEAAGFALRYAEMARASAGDVKAKTIYFDSVYTSGWGDGNDFGFTNTVYVYLYGYDGISVLKEMSVSQRENALIDYNTEGNGKLWECEIPEAYLGKITGAIFLVNPDPEKNGWPRDNYNRTVDAKIKSEDGNDIGEYPCFSLDHDYKFTGSGDDHDKRLVKYWGSLDPLTLEGNEVYFFDMTSELDTNEPVEARFRVDGMEASEVLGEKDDETGGYIIPANNINNSAYNTVTFYDSKGNILDGPYNLFNKTTGGATGFSYNAETMNTFYYGATEKTDGTIISYWGAPLPEDAEIQEGQTLYFDKLYFKVPKAADGNSEESGDADMGDSSGTETSGARFQIGNGELRPLGIDEQDRRTYIYVFSGGSATSQTILTYIDQDGTKYHFFWDEFDLKNADGTVVTGGNNLVTLESEIARVMGQYELGNWIYFDATLSKLSYAGSADIADGIPKGIDPVWCWMAKDEWGTGADVQPMEKVADREGWKDVWKINLPDGYTYVRFANYKMNTTIGDGDKWANATDKYLIPSNLYDDPCFYADSGDDVLYNCRNGNKLWWEGYWEEVYTVRDAEKYKENRDVVDIAQGTFTRASSVLYVDSTFYDYYSDYELNGNNRDNYGGDNGVSHRNWVTFRQFDQALSDFYEENGASVPIYTGHFQWPGWGDNSYPFSKVNETLKLYGADNENKFYSTNNSTINLSGNKGHYDDAAQGLVSDTLSDGSVVIKGGSALLPYFDEDFLTGNNSKNAVLGEVYENVAFPFTSEDPGNNGIKYWTFDSKDTTLAMRQDSSTDQYYLENVGNQEWSRNVNSTGGKDWKDPVSTKYGFFPFNETSAGTSGKNYNYGFGTKLEFKFRLTSDGTVLDNNEVAHPIVFEFAGDDDVWVFIDGKLALDVGGAHGRVEGKLNFQEKTAWVSGTKTSAGSGDGGGEKTTNFTMVGDNTSEHTLTMFYMERGMWESNMRVTFNFPDENQLAVEKKVNVSGVNPAFQGLFQDASLFSFEIKNYATHYEELAASTASNSVTKMFNSSATFADANIGKDSDKNTFAVGSTIGDRSNVVHWKALYDEPGGGYKDQRCGIIYPSTGKGTGMDLSDANRYLQFDVYYDNDGIPALNHMYIELVDNAGFKILRTLNGVTYGSIDLNRRVWTTITVDLDKFAKGYSGFNWANVQAVRFGYNYERDIYLDNFIFKSTPAATTLTGFITKQYQIPSYGSVGAKGLVYPNGAQYTLTAADGRTSYGVIGDDGKFALADRESVLFRDQFRRGSYISLREIADEEVFDTSWIMYENGQIVTRMKGGGTVDPQGESNFPATGNRDSYYVDDGRTEIYSTGQGQDSKALNNDGYTSTHRPDERVFVFRSYAEPNYENGMTKLKVVYTNTVKTGSLTIRKEKSENSEELTGTYTFNVVFTNVAGMGLESEPIKMTFTLKQGQERTITGIPINTEFTITETPSDKSILENVTAVQGRYLTFDSKAKEVTGQITPDNAAVKLTFINMLKPVINIDVTKTWKNADNTDVADDELPEYLLIRLQRRVKGSQAAWQDVTIKGQETPDIKIGNNQARTWEYRFADLDKYVENEDGTRDTLWEYRVVEVQEKKDSNGNVTRTVVEGGGIWDNRFQVTYSDPVFGNEALPPEANENLESTIKNIHTVSLKVKKVDATNNPLGGVTFKLEKKNGDNWETVNVTKPDGSVQDSLTTLSTTENEFGGAGIVIFAGLPSGEYQLTEIKTAAGHTLLASPILININTDGSFTYTIDGGDPMTPEDNTIVLTIKNGQNLVMPATGGAGPIPFTVGGLSICMIASLMYIDSMRKRRKEGKAS